MNYQEPRHMSRFCLLKCKGFIILFTWWNKGSGGMGMLKKSVIFAVSKCNASLLTEYAIIDK